MLHAADSYAHSREKHVFKHVSLFTLVKTIRGSVSLKQVSLGRKQDRLGKSNLDMSWKYFLK